MSGSMKDKSKEEQQWCRKERESIKRGNDEDRVEVGGE